MFNWFTKEKEIEDKKLSCGHFGADLSHGFGNGLLGEKKKVIHIFCTRCDIHFYNDREWTRDQWEEYVNDFSHDPESLMNKKY